MSKTVYLSGAGASVGTRENGIGSPHEFIADFMSEDALSLIGYEK